MATDHSGRERVVVIARTLKIVYRVWKRTLPVAHHGSIKAVEASRRVSDERAAAGQQQHLDEGVVAPFV
jgi:hypothetical protein